MGARLSEAERRQKRRSILILAACVLAIVAELAVISHYSGSFDYSFYQYIGRKKSRDKRAEYVLIEERPQDRTRKEDQVKIVSGVSNPGEHAWTGFQDQKDD